jgi:hypothetical protein
MFTHQRDLDVNTLMYRLDRSEIEKFNNNDVSGEGYVRLQPGDRNKLYTENELGDLIRHFNAGGHRETARRAFRT